MKINFFVTSFSISIWKKTSTSKLMVSSNFKCQLYGICLMWGVPLITIACVLLHQIMVQDFYSFSPLFQFTSFYKASGNSLGPLR